MSTDFERRNEAWEAYLQAEALDRRAFTRYGAFAEKVIGDLSLAFEAGYRAAVADYVRETYVAKGAVNGT